MSNDCNRAEKTLTRHTNLYISTPAFSIKHPVNVSSHGVQRKRSSLPVPAPWPHNAITSTLTGWKIMSAACGNNSTHERVWLERSVWNSSRKFWQVKPECLAGYATNLFSHHCASYINYHCRYFGYVIFANNALKYDLFIYISPAKNKLFV